MRLGAATAAGLLTALVLVGCGSPPEPTPQAASTAPIALPSSSALTDSLGLLPDAEYLELVRENTDWWDTAPDDKLLDNGRLLCDVLETGLTDDQFLTQYLAVLKTLTDSGVPAGEAGSYIVFAAAQYCAEQVVRLQNLPGA